MGVYREQASILRQFPGLGQIDEGIEAGLAKLTQTGARIGVAVADRNSPASQRPGMTQ